MPGKTPMWGNPREREREIYYPASGNYISTTINISSNKRNPLTTH
jgi:hypothetical protein